MHPNVLHYFPALSTASLASQTRLPPLPDLLFPLPISTRTYYTNPAVGKLGSVESFPSGFLQSVAVNVHTELENAALVTVVLKRLSKARVLCGRQVVWDNGYHTETFICGFVHMVSAPTGYAWTPRR